MILRSVDNPPNPYDTRCVEWLEPPPTARLEVYEETASSILSENDSPDLPFRWSVNPYRGCQHACAYCYARPYHEYLGYGAGTDFETKLVAKINAPELLERAFRGKKWQRESVNFSGVTDCYQPMEACYELTRRCLEVCLEYGNPAGIVTKGFLVVRDAELLSKLNQVSSARVYLSIPFADAGMAKLIEPQAPTPSRRFEAIRRLRECGVPVGVMVAPIIPGLNDSDIPKILEQAAEAGAQSASYTVLRLSGSVEPVFLSRIREVLPLRAERIISRLGEIRGGKLTDSRFGHRMRGEGTYWESIRSLFSLMKKKYGFESIPYPTAPEEVAPPESRETSDQLELPFL
ncbi:MAG: PA0069 family radical SAM protein [Planctomycetota bacterium]